MTDQSSVEPHYLVTRYVRMCAAKGVTLAPGCQVLDFGCGAGETVYWFRDAGYDAHGFDIHNFAKLRAPEDERFFKVVAGNSQIITNFTVDGAQFRMPYPDATFDFICSQTVMEHVQDHAAILREMARVLKPTGAMVHTFPPKFIFIEPHTGVPYASLFQSRLYFLFWAQFGIRGPYQQTFTAQLSAQQNAKYFQHGINYVAPWNLLKLGRRRFANLQFTPQLWEAGGPREKALRDSVFARALYTTTRNIVWFLAAPKPPDLIDSA